MLEKNSIDNLQREEEVQVLSPVRIRRKFISHELQQSKPGTLEAMRDFDLYRSTGSLESDDSSNYSPTKIINDDRMTSLLEEKLKIYN